MATDVLTSLSIGELEALADSLLAPSNQARLQELLAAQGLRSAAEEAELDRLLDRVDQLNVLKARAKFTLAHNASTT